MAEPKSFLKDMVESRSNKDNAGTTKPSTEKVKPVSKSSGRSYDAQAFGLLKLRLGDQRQQLSVLSDYSEDTAIKLNDIYEILKDMKPVAVQSNEDSYVSSLDSFFNDNGYIPVKVLNPCCGDNNNDPNDLDKERNKNKKSWSSLAAEKAFALAAAILPVSALVESLSGNVQPAPVTTPAPLINPSPADAPIKIPQFVPPANIPGILAQPPAIANDLPPIKLPQDEFDLSPIDLIETLSTLQKLLNAMKSSPALGVGSPSKLLRGGGGAGRQILSPRGYMDPLQLSAYNVGRDNVIGDLQARKLNFIAKEMTYEADRFEFVERSTITASSSSQTNYTNASFSPPNNKSYADSPTPASNVVAPSGNGITQQQAYELALNAGFNESEARTMAAIAVAESSLNPGALNPKGKDLSYGLWQINMLGKLGVERRSDYGLNSNEELYDPATNARVAYEVYKEQGFDAWSAYSSGAYQKYVNNRVETQPNKSITSTVTRMSSGMMSGVSDFLGNLIDLSASTTMQMNMPATTSKPATAVPVNVTTPTTPAYTDVSDPLVAMGADISDMFSSLFGPGAYALKNLFK